MATFHYNATSHFAEGVFSGDNVEFITPLVSSINTNKKSQRVRTALSGRRRTRILNRTTTRAIESPVITTSELEAEWRQFLNSIDDGQTFEMDGQLVQIDQTWQEVLVNSAKLWYRFTFTVYYIR